MKLGLVELLRGAWIAGTLPLIIASLPISGLIITSFRATLLGFAKRGKIMQSSSSIFTVPQRFFLHFYALAVVWTSFLLVPAWIFACATGPLLVLDPSIGGTATITSYLTGSSNGFSFHSIYSISTSDRNAAWQAVFLLLLMEVQVLRRLYETLFVFRYSPAAHMHIFGYLTGLFSAQEVYNFIVNQVMEFTVEGKSQMLAFEFKLWHIMNPVLKLGWHQWIGATIFFWGWIHQCRCHAILGYIRQNPELRDKYAIPHGDWFEIVSSPHYLSEIVIYAGLVVASGGTDLTVWLLFCFVVANLVFAAAETHRWYLEKFEDYPSNRFAIIPHVF